MAVTMAASQKAVKRMAEEMSDKEMMKVSVEEFSRLQRYMMLAEKDSESYKAMKERYIELKVILTTFGVNITELDRIKE